MKLSRLLLLFISANLILGTQSVAYAANTASDIKGSLDVATCQEIKGWACDSALPNQNADLEISFSSPGVLTQYGYATANTQRVAKAYNSIEIEDLLLSSSVCNRPTDVNRRKIGWSMPVPQSVKDGKTYTVKTRVIDNFFGKDLTYFWDKVDYQSSTKKYTITCGQTPEQNTVSVTPCVYRTGQASCFAETSYRFENSNYADICKTEGTINYNEGPMSRISLIPGNETGGTGLLNVPLTVGVQNNFYMLGSPVGGTTDPTTPACSGALLAQAIRIEVITPTTTPLPATSTPIPPTVTNTPVPPSPTPRKLGDVDGVGGVTIADFNEVLGYFGTYQTNPYLDADLDRSGRVWIEDFNEVLAYFGT